MLDKAASRVLVAGALKKFVPIRNVELGLLNIFVLSCNASSAEDFFTLQKCYKTMKRLLR